MAVSATVLSSCSVGTSTLTFTSYDPVSPTVTTAMGNISVTCSTGQTYTVALNQGAHGGSVTTRQMQDVSANGLNYYINRSNCGTALCNNWGQTNGTDTVNGTGTGVAQSITAYGVIPNNQAVPAGVYTDTVSITVTFPFP